MITINVNFSENTILTDNLTKLGMLGEYFSLDGISGEITEYKAELLLTKNNRAWRLNANWIEEQQTMPCELIDHVGNVLSFNFSPLNSMGGLDLRQFEKELITA